MSRPYEPPWTPMNRELVAALKMEHPNLRTGQMMPAIAAAFPDDAGLDLPPFKRVPDAFGIYPDERRVDLFEVEVTHPISKETMLDICRLWQALDACDVDLHLYAVTRYGHINEIDIAPWYFDHDWRVAERVGFEPTIRCRIPDFESAIGSLIFITN